MTNPRFTGQLGVDAMKDGNQIATEAVAAFDNWRNEHDPEGNMNVLEQAEAYSKAMECHHALEQMDAAVADGACPICLLTELGRLRVEAHTLAADQCHDGIAGEHGHHICREVEHLKAQLKDMIRGLALIASDGSHNSGEFCAKVAMNYLQCAHADPYAPVDATEFIGGSKK